jgi:hypothetical protein
LRTKFPVGILNKRASYSDALAASFVIFFRVYAKRAKKSQEPLKFPIILSRNVVYMAQAFQK